MVAAQKVSPPYPVFTDLDGQPLDNGKVYIGTVNLDPVANPILVYYDEALTLLATQPIRTHSGYPYYQGTPANLYTAEDDFSITVNTASNIQVFTSASVEGIADLRAQLAASSGSSLVGYIEGGAGSVATTVQNALRWRADAVRDYGCDNTGATNTTTKLKAFFDNCIATGKPGRIPAGTYKVTPGVLVFNCNFVDTPWPEIETDGHYFTKFLVDSASAVDAPIITITNGTPTSAVGQYWRGGSLGGLSFEDTRTGHTATHGISLQGHTEAVYGYMYSEDLLGDLFHFPQNLFGGTNPDPTAITHTRFIGAEGIRCLGWTMRNLNYVGMDGVTVEYARGIENEGGGIYGCGQGCNFLSGSFGSCKGWAWDDGTNLNATGGAPNRTTVVGFEIDNCEYGIRLNRGYMSNFTKTRFVHRYNFGPYNPSGGYWPRVAISIGEGASPNIVDTNIQVTHRVESGGTKPDMGVFLQTNATGSANMLNVNIEQYIIDNAAFGFADSDLFTGFTSNSRVLLTRAGKNIFDTRYAYYAKASSSTVSVLNGGFSATQILVFGTEITDGYGAYDPLTGIFTLQYAGKVEVDAKVCLTMAAGSRVRLGVSLTRSGVSSVIDESYSYAITAAAQHYPITTTFDGLAGDAFQIVADQNSGGDLVVSSPVGAQQDNRVIFRVIGAP